MIIMDELSGLREGYAEVGDQRLHYMEAGEGPLIVLLHGFPELWYGWRQQIEPPGATIARRPAASRPSQFLAVARTVPPGRVSVAGVDWRCDLKVAVSATGDIRGCRPGSGR
jgi:pimeloyl-ACP methyl ester carboxylesterase